MEQFPTVTVVTLTSGRGEELLGCVQSVISQDYLGPIEHMVVNDSSSWVATHRDVLLGINPVLMILDLDLDAERDQYQPFYWPSRSGYMRNRAFAESSGTYIAQLDDDNTIESNHISSLVTVLGANDRDAIAYSWRCILHPDGSPYLEAHFPWKVSCPLAEDENLVRAFIYRRLVEQGILSQGTNIMRDTVVSDDGLLVCTVDNSEMLMSRDVMRRYPYKVWFNWREMLHLHTDDYTFVRQAYEAGVTFIPTKQATLNYFLGGISNRIVMLPTVLGDTQSI